MPGIVKIRRLFLLLLLNLFFFVCGTLIKIFPLTPEQKLHLQTRFMRLWARSGCFILGIHIMSIPPHCPTFVRGGRRGGGPFFIASNHCSYVDILIIGSIMPAVFVSKSDVASWALLGRMVKLAGTIFVNRESKTASVRVLEAIKERLTSGINVVVFPEGTTNNGLNIMDFKSTFFKAPIDSRVPVLPVSIIYSHIDRAPVTPGTIDAVAWHSDMEFLPHFWNLLGIRRIDARIHFSPPLYHFTEDRKTLSSFVCEKVRDGIEIGRCFREKDTVEL